MQVSFTAGGTTSLLLRANTASTKTAHHEIIKELSGGEHSDLARRVDGKFRALSGIESFRSELTSYQKNADFASGSLKTQDAILNTILTSVADFQNAIIEYGGLDSVTDPKALKNDAIATLKDLSIKLNSNFAGLSQFAGSAVETVPFTDGQAVLDQLTADIAAPNSVASDLRERANAWFDLNGASGEKNFKAFAFKGHTEAEQSIPIGQSETVDLYIDPISPGIVNAFKGASLIAIGAQLQADGNFEASAEMLRAGSAALTESKAGLTATIAEIGNKQSRLERVSAENAARLSATTIARNDIRQVDDYEKISELDDVEARLQAIYSLTARLSKLSLLEFLR